MLDYYRNAVTQLLRCNYDIFLPLQKPFGDELVVSNGNWLYRGMIRSVVMSSQQGPYVSLKMSRQGDKYLIDGLEMDVIIASCPQSSDVWLIHLSEVGICNSIRIADRPKLEPIERTGVAMSIDEKSDLLERLRAEQTAERVLVKDAKSENEFYKNILEERNDE